MVWNSHIQQTIGRIIPRFCLAPPKKTEKSSQFIQDVGDFSQVTLYIIGQLEVVTRML